MGKVVPLGGSDGKPRSTGPGRRSRRRGEKTALVLGGGGFTGGVYEIGALRALDLLTARPARVLGIEAGRLAKGLPADLCLFDLERIWKVEAGLLPGKAPNTPFDGRALEGRVVGTWKAGQRVFG